MKVDGRKLFLRFLCLLVTGTSLVTGALALSPDKGMTQYLHAVWSTRRGLPQNTAHAILQTRDGYLWIGTQQGLARFDGVSFRIFNRENTPALRKNLISRLCEGADRSLWIGTFGAGLLRCRDGRFTAMDPSTGLSSSFIYSLCNDDDGSVWVGTDSGLDRVRGGRCEDYPGKAQRPRTGVRSLARDRWGWLWIGADSGLMRYRNGTFERVPLPAELQNSSILALLVSPFDNRLWVGTNKGLAWLSAGQFHACTPAEGLSSPFVEALATDRHGNVWVGTHDGGLNRYRDGRFQCIRHTDGLPSDMVLSLHEDTEGGLWVGTNEGIDRIGDAKFTVLTTREGLTNNQVRTVFQDGARNLWAGTHGGGLNRIGPDGSVRVYGVAEGLSDGFVYAIGESADSEIWVGTMNGGLYRVTDGKAALISGPRENNPRGIRVIYRDSRNRMWIGTYQDGLELYQDGKLTSFPAQDLFAGMLIRFVLEDRRGRLWIGTHKGVFVMEDRRTWRYTTAQGLSANETIFAFQDREGEIWVSTLDGGLNRFSADAGRFRSYTTKDGLYNDMIFCILEDDDGRFWMTSNQGIFRVDKSAFRDYDEGRVPRIPCIAYTEKDGLLTAECNGGSQPSGVRAADGRLWFPTKKGLASIDPRNILVNRIAPPVAVEEVSIDERAHPVRDSVDVPAGARTLEIRFAALTFVFPESVRFRYCLEGYDARWYETSEERKAKYANLPPGDYVFRVTACNSDGVWNPTGTAIRFTVRPLFVQTWWFYGLCVLAGTLAVGGLFRLRLRAIQRRHRELERLVEQRTWDLQEEKNRTENALSEVRVQKDIAQEALRLKTDLMHMAVHDLKNPLQTILGYSELIPRRLEEKGTVLRMSNSINLSADRMLNLINSLLKSAAIENGKITLNRRCVSLNRVLHEALEGNRVRSEGKNQRVEVETDPDVVVRGDEERLREVIDNLVDNAIKYAPPGTLIRVRLTRENGFALFRVQDEGPGLTEEDQKHLFESFHRLSAKPTGSEPSTGLGLSIVRKLVELHGGRVYAESTYGLGSVFVVELPLAPEGEGAEGS
ncbi:MAG: hypothetical protein KA419_05085 [Acidobacteria bacterium]|nr:hypothetical protein [Acidobacteriota bacterium]